MDEVHLLAVRSYPMFFSLFATLHPVFTFVSDYEQQVGVLSVVQSREEQEDAVEACKWPISTLHSHCILSHCQCPSGILVDVVGFSRSCLTLMVIYVYVHSWCLLQHHLFTSNTVIQRLFFSYRVFCSWSRQVSDTDNWSIPTTTKWCPWAFTTAQVLCISEKNYTVRSRVHTRHKYKDKKENTILSIGNIETTMWGERVNGCRSLYIVCERHDNLDRKPIVLS